MEKIDRSPYHSSPIYFPQMAFKWWEQKIGLQFSIITESKRKKISIVLSICICFFCSHTHASNILYTQSVLMFFYNILCFLRNILYNFYAFNYYLLLVVSVKLRICTCAECGHVRNERNNLKWKQGPH